ncbi:hypothetical protein MSAN_02292500 [Mycena sanguinolenta]|uniref:Uncharacterized protein n=1 Tax=Mycena sanguinolenta TaxID=230812 RepID=A0A8H6X8L0_9AGAR|nr:hypothetical protein MSAN_02292500 [Mycena sanguinolenta]
MSVSEDVFLLVVDAVAARHPRCLRSMASACRKAHELIKVRWFRVLCVQDAPRSALYHRMAGARAGWSLTGFPLVTYSRFVELLRDRPEEVRAVRHLHIAVNTADAFARVFEGCPNLVALWLHHSLPRAMAAGILGLKELRELTIPMGCLVQATSVVLPSVTRIHFGPVLRTETLHPRALAAFPSLTHVGFESEPRQRLARRVADSSEGLRVLVRVDPWSEHRYEPHPRIVYMVRLDAGPNWDWLKRAAPGWNAWSTVEDESDVIWDQWTMLDAVLDARKLGRLRHTVVSNYPLYFMPALRRPTSVSRVL